MSLIAPPRAHHIEMALAADRRPGVGGIVMPRDDGAALAGDGAGRLHAPAAMRLDGALEKPHQIGVIPAALGLVGRAVAVNSGRKGKRYKGHQCCSNISPGESDVHSIQDDSVQPPVRSSCASERRSQRYTDSVFSNGAGFKARWSNRRRETARVPIRSRGRTRSEISCLNRRATGRSWFWQPGPNFAVTRSIPSALMSKRR